jgi:aminoglycoside 2'-N-acetyltransferase I
VNDRPPVHLDVVSSRALDEGARADIIKLCESAYGEDFSHLFVTLPDAVHVLARDQRGVLVSHAEWVTRWLQPAGHAVLRTAYIEAVATAPTKQGQGLATAVLRRIHELIAADPTWELGALSPSTPTLYARLGWESWKGPLAIRRAEGLEPTPADEQVMILRLPPTPSTLLTTSLLSAEWRSGELW